MKIAVLVSGGVDSSLALNLLKEQGHDLTAFYLKIWLENELSFLGNCPWEQDLSYVQRVCEQLNVPLKVVSMQQEYWDKVVAYTISEVKAGRTPSPDLLCNKYIKFGAFFYLVGHDFDKVASGHYANVAEQDGFFVLKRARDPIKDQTYFLSRLTQDQLAKAMFPIGNLHKTEVRNLAHSLALATADRKDSQGICFLGKINFADFIKHHVGTKQGDLIDIDTKKKVGIHQGFWFYTIGQRKGIGLSGGPWYVVAKDSEKNIVYISCNYYAENKKRDVFTVSDFNWIGPVCRGILNDITVKVRHGEQDYRCTVQLDQESKKGMVILEQQDQGIAAGQFAVFYREDVCFASAVIE